MENTFENNKSNSVRVLQTFTVHPVYADTKHGRDSTVATPQKSPRHYSSLQTTQQQSQIKKAEQIQSRVEPRQL